MDWLTFTAELIKALAWPLLALTLLVALRRPLLNLLPSIGRVKFKDFELEFGRRLEAAAAQAAELEQAQERESQDQEAQDGPAADLLQLAALSPLAAILEAWIRTEAAALQAARLSQIEISTVERRAPQKFIGALKQRGVIDARQALIFDELRGLRNAAAHAGRFHPSSNAAAEYIRLAARLERSLAQR